MLFTAEKVSPVSPKNINVDTVMIPGLAILDGFGLQIGKLDVLHLEVRVRTQIRLQIRSLD